MAVLSVLAVALRSMGKPVPASATVPSSESVLGSKVGALLNASTFPLGTTAATCTATDGAGNSVSCQFNVTVTDTTPPVIACNAPATIGPPDAPIAFAATATDSCGPASVSVQGYDCWAINGAGRRIDKKGACVVRFADNTLTVEDSGGVGDHITWTLSATDGNGNVASTSCEVLVVNPGHGK